MELYQTILLSTFEIQLEAILLAYFYPPNLSLCVCLLQLAIFPDSLERRLTALKELV